MALQGYLVDIAAIMSKRTQDSLKKSGSDDVTRSFREMPPMHYTLEIDSFSQLQKILSSSSTKSFESQIFEAGGFKWKLSLYPNGDEERNGKGHLSLFLAIAESEALPLDWEADVEFKFFVFDQIRDNYFMVQDARGRVRRFHRLKTEWGFAQLLPHNTFRDANNGYLIRDKCLFGAEIFVSSRSSRGERLTLAMKPDVVAYTWKIDQFSSLDNSLNSPVFTLGNFKWELQLYPKGDLRAAGDSISLFLCMKDSKAAARVYTEFTLTIRNQLNNNHRSRKSQAWFSASSRGWGFDKLIPLRDIGDVLKGFVVKDTLIVEARIESLSILRGLSRKS